MNKSLRNPLRLRQALAIAALTLTASFAQATSFLGYDMQLVGSASVLDPLNLQMTPNATDNVGAAWVTTALSTTQDFSANFSFSISGTPTIANGIAFVLQSGGTSAIGSGGGGIGLEGLDAVASIIHTFGNNHVGFTGSGDPFSVQDAPTDLGAAMSITGFQTVSYDSIGKMMFMTGIITVDGTDFEVSDVLSVDLEARFGSSMYVGFTGATGSLSSDQRITDFSLAPAPVPEPETYALMLAGLGLVGWQLRRRRHA
ncbi:MAG: PEP-CTERM sorting domain-containing protein [Betaproteobacteria bacterium]